MWPFLNVPEILQMRATAQEFFDAAKYSPYCASCFFLMHHETDPTEPVPDIYVSTGSLFFFAQLEAQLPARNDRLSQEALANAGMAWFKRPNGPGRLCAVHGLGLHAPGFFSSFIRDRSDSCPEGVSVSQRVYRVTGMYGNTAWAVPYMVFGINGRISFSHHFL